MGRFLQGVRGVLRRPGPGVQPAHQRRREEARRQPGRSDGLATGWRQLRRDRRALDRRGLLDHEQHEILRDDPAQPRLRRRLREYPAQALRLHRHGRRDQLRREGRARERPDPRRPRVVAARRGPVEPRLAGRPALRLHEQHRLRVRRPEPRGGALVPVPAVRQAEPQDARGRRRHPAGRHQLRVRAPRRRRQPGAPTRVRLRSGHRRQAARATSSSPDIRSCRRSTASPGSASPTARSTTRTGSARTPTTTSRPEASGW